VTSVAKQSDLADQCNGSENGDWKMQLPAYQNEGVRHLTAVTAIT
jgi:hypothetical protein